MSEITTSIRKHLVRLTQAEAEIRFLVSTSAGGADLHIRGRLMGPRCPYSSTIEVAYPLKEIERSVNPTGGTSILLRTVIPDPSMWDPQSPFLYSGPLGIWQADQALEQNTVQIGFVGWGLGTRGLRVNGKFLNLQAAAIDELDVSSCGRLREKGVNCLVVDVAQVSGSVWDLADRYGFFVFGRLRTAAGWDRARMLEGRPSTLGWILNESALSGYKPRGIEGTTYTGSAPLIGLEVGQLAPAAPAGISFLVAGPDAASQSEKGGLPWLRVQRTGEALGGLDVAEGILGTLRNWPPAGEVRL
jgi:hypothetical protein